MNIKKYLLASLGVYIAIQVTDFIIHGLILSQSYQALMHLWRPNMMDKMWVMYIGGVIFSLFFVYVFTKGYEGKGVVEGVRYGLIIGLLMNLVGILGQYAVYPLPFILVVQWIAYGLVQFVLYGSITAAIYKPVSDS